MEWNNKEEVLKLIKQLHLYKKYEAYEFIETFDKEMFFQVSEAKINQDTIYGIESRKIKKYFVSAVISSIRDFCNNGSSSNGAEEGVEVIKKLGSKSARIRKLLRREIIHNLNYNGWNNFQYANGNWKCPYCGNVVKEYESYSVDEGWARRTHLTKTHPDSLPSKYDFGNPCSWNYEFVRKMFLYALAGLFREKSYLKYRHYFSGEPNALEFLDERFRND
jgi:hypothetical protein